jgi:hypothetical protein
MGSFVMKRAAFSIFIAAILALAGTLAFDAIRAPGESAAFAAKGHKTCRAKTSTGKTKTWRCGADQACCVNKFMDLYVCGYPGLGCL